MSVIGIDILPYFVVVLHYFNLRTVRFEEVIVASLATARSLLDPIAETFGRIRLFASLTLTLASTKRTYTFVEISIWEETVV